MSRARMNQLRRDLDHVFPNGGYELRWSAGERVQLVLDDDVHRNVRQFAEELLRLHRVPFDVRLAEQSEASPAPV